ncbi:MAG: amidohydrolase family protein [Candidatus Bathyarchaeota archaeon]|nr:amidohydrolase family protein [Candidatus Bathyarchaeota archaeon]
MSEEYDILVNDALIVDGTGAPSYKGSVAVKGDRIKALGKKIDGDAVTVIDGKGMVVSPGFIDVHNHGDLSIMYYPRAEGFLQQGITTFVGGQCGDSPGPFGDWIGLPWVLGDLYTDIAPMMYVKSWLQPRDKVNQRHKEVYGWEIDWDTMAGFFKRLEGMGFSPNYVPLVGHGDIRSLVMGPDFKRHATGKEIKEMVKHTKQAMEEGCRGITVGRDYDPGIWASFDEILACAKVAAKYGGVYGSHSLRTGHRKPRRPGEFSPVKTKGVLEAIDVGRKAKMSVQVSHLGVLYDVTPSDNKELMKEAVMATLKIIDDARAEGIDVSFDEIPNHLTGGIGTSPWLVHSLRPWLAIAGSPEQLAEALRMPDFREEIKTSIWAGKHYRLNPNINRYWASARVVAECKVEEFREKTITDIAEEKNIDELDALFKVLKADPYTKVERRGDNDWVKLEFYKHPEMMIGIDTFAVDDKRESWHHPPSYPNQNSYGGFPCYLRRTVREAKVMSIEEAVRKITGSPAQKFKLTDRGVLKTGAYADIVVWDPESITDKGTQIVPRQYPEGIPYVIVNGELVVKNSVHAGALPGKVLVRE